MEENIAAIHAHPLLPSIITSLVRDHYFEDLDADIDVVFETQHHDQTLYWAAEDTNMMCTQLSLWSNTVDSCWCIYADLLLDPRVPAAPITVKLLFTPTPNHPTDRPSHEFEGVVRTHGDWEVILKERIEVWLEEGYAIEEEEEQMVSDEDTDRDSE